MIYNAKSGSIKIDKTQMDYVAFGNGKKTLVMIPGLGDGLRSVKGTEVPVAMMYHEAAKDYTVYMLSRRNSMPVEFTTREMAEDVYIAMQRLGILKAHVMGVSLGGMIAQHLALEHPEVIKKLVLAVTISKPNDTIRQVISNWIDLARQGQYKEIMMDTAQRSYTEKYLKKMKWMYQVVGNVGKPKSFDRFITMAKACLSHNVYEELPRIQVPTLIIGGDEDQIVTGAASVELSEQIPGSQLMMYEGLGHGLYDEADDFIGRVLEFFG